MLETFVSSRIRRALLEHILRHPQDRFYLRGLARELGLSVSPLRRELKRMEHSGMLQAIQEGNILFYQVNAASAAFLQLKGTEAPSPLAAMPQAGFGALGSGLGALAHSPEPTAQSVQAIPVGVISQRSGSFWHSPLNTPALVGAAGVGMALMLIIAVLAYLTLTSQRLASQVSRTLTTEPSEVTVVVPNDSTAGTMRGGRWRIVPGGFGGFSPSANPESY